MRFIELAAREKMCRSSDRAELEPAGPARRPPRLVRPLPDSYCGLGVVMRSSSDWVKDKNGNRMRAVVQATRGLNRKHNTMAKCVMKGAATTAIAQTTTPLGQHYAKLLAAGTKPNLAKLTIARRIALALWKTMEEYDPTKKTKEDSRLAS